MINGCSHDVNRNGSCLNVMQKIESNVLLLYVFLKRYEWMINKLLQNFKKTYNNKTFDSLKHKVR